MILFAMTRLAPILTQWMKEKISIEVFFAAYEQVDKIKKEADCRPKFALSLSTKC